MSVCLSVCFLFIYVCLSIGSHITKTHGKIAPNFLLILPVIMARSSSDGTAICFVLPIFWMTSCLQIMERIGQTIIYLFAYVRRFQPISLQLFVDYFSTTDRRQTLSCRRSSFGVRDLYLREIKIKLSHERP